MKKRAEFLVTKRDGRQEWLRASKLARSIHLALYSVQEGEDSIWRALELSATVLLGLRCKRELEDGSLEPWILTTEELAMATQKVLAVTGNEQAAVAYADAAVSQRRRQAILRQRNFLETAVIGEGFGVGPKPSSGGSDGGRWQPPRNESPFDGPLDQGDGPSSSR